MRPSERIKQIEEKLIRADWVNGAGRHLDLDPWIEANQNKAEYKLRAIEAYLDEEMENR